MLSQNRLTFRNIFTEVFDGNKKTDGLSRKKKSNIDKSEIIGINTDIFISINTDMNSPIIKLSDYYINEDVNELIPLLLNKLEEDK